MSQDADDPTLTLLRSLNVRLEEAERLRNSVAVEPRPFWPERRRIGRNLGAPPAKPLEHPPE